MSDQFKGILLMTLAMAVIPAVDGFAKALSADYPALLISFARYAVAAAVVTPIAMGLKGRDIFPKRHRLLPHIMRTMFLVTGMTCYYMAISRIELATAISAFFVGPIIATPLAAIILKEKLTTVKVVALILGFSGTLFIARPSGSMDPGVLLALASGTLFGFYIIATRLASGETPPLQSLTFQCLFGAVLLIPQAIYAWTTPAPEHLWMFIAMGVLSPISHGLSIAAFRYADASTLSPLVYLELAGTAIIGYYFFHEVPSLSVWIGAAIIIASGLLLTYGARAKL
jgi:drug/metabolite transporter (DMT)-like permease